MLLNSVFLDFIENSCTYVYQGIWPIIFILCFTNLGVNLLTFTMYIFTTIVSSQWIVHFISVGYPFGIILS
jgi:hypothetical protein